jgi:S1-C subfamily serine protease
MRRRLAVVGCCVLAACANPAIDDAETVAVTDTVTLDTTTLDTITVDTIAVRDEAVLDSTVRVRADGCGPRTRLGIGTLVDESLVVTAAHVVAGSERVEVVDRTGSAAPVDVVVFDPDQDLAVLRADAPVGTVAVVRPDEPSAGDQGIVAVTDDGSGADHALELVDATITRAVTVRTTDIYGDGVVLRDGFEIDASIEPGDSGTMVHFPGGVSGVVWARSLDAVDRAWAVGVPPDLLDANPSTPVDTGACP